mmetsp:Transcript_13013/g.32437  ORF Transcript_13013/g.32437 Transcript_13013/m.32437 type:complete len:317 (-) Transcript_13013:1274-2224(-)
MFFHDFLGGRTLKMMPSVNGSRLSMSSSSASPPSVIIWYSSFSFSEMTLKPAMNSCRRFFRSSSCDARCVSRSVVNVSRCSCLLMYSACFSLYASSALMSGFIDAIVPCNCAISVERASTSSNCAASSSADNERNARRFSSSGTSSPRAAAYSAAATSYFSRVDARHAFQCFFVPFASVTDWLSSSSSLSISISMLRNLFSADSYFAYVSLSSARRLSASSSADCASAYSSRTPCDDSASLAKAFSRDSRSATIFATSFSLFFISASRRATVLSAVAIAAFCDASSDLAASMRAVSSPSSLRRALSFGPPQLSMRS